MATKLLIIALILLTCLSYLSAYLPDKENYLNLLDEIDNSLDNIRNYEVDRNHDETEYKPFFDSLFNHELETELKPKRIQKRFIKSLIELLKPKNKTKPTPHANDNHDFFDSYSDDEEEEDNDNSFFPKKTTTTTRRPIHFSSTTKSRILTTTHKPPAPLPSAAEEDPFYRLKNHCALNFDQLCSGKKSEMYELVLKCERLKLEHSNQRLEPCREVYSIYCYVFNDRFTCLGQDYDTYVPGRKKFTTSGTRTTTRSTSTVTIKINVITTSSYRPPVVTTTTRTTTRPTTRAVVTTTTKPTTRFVVTTTTTHRPTTKASSGGGSASGDPFGDGPVQIPNNADRLKEIGEFCLKTKTKNTKCDTMLKMLKDRFKTCEKKPKSDNECQSFKINFCTAYNNFPCCPDVLAGRSCSGKSNSQARRMLYM